MMSRQNVEAVRRWYAASPVTPGDFQSLIAEIWDPEGDYYPVRKFPEARPCHGRDEVSRFLVDWSDAWVRHDNALRDVIEVGDDRVLACATLQAQGRESGMRLEGDIFFCVWLRHGRLLRVEDHLTLKGALHALGLQGETLAAAGLAT